ncbi:capsular polysaccharide biosynthesis protein [Halodurantibacterium flavum]|uniref:Capsular polysaccharide biosynthesis protein n=1 Tax=Halodurantibacterium flavum TaxID=1382802 RepID=A0ABW4S8I5_9RHOB
MPARDPAPRTRAYSLGLFRGRVARILSLAGYAPRFGLPGAGDAVLVWGHGRTAWRGEAMARRRGCSLIRAEDALLRSVHPGRSGTPPLGLLIDRRGIYYDATGPSDLEHLLAQHPLSDKALLDRARLGIERLIAGDLSKYNAHDPAAPRPAPGYVLVVDQVRGDASIRLGGANDASFARMLAAARTDHPDRRILIKTHPETQGGIRPGHFGPADRDARTALCTDPLSPWALLQGAVAVYTVTSQFGFEAILAGHRPEVFGQPFYAGWGLSSDRVPAPPRRQRNLSPEQLFAAAMILFPVWYDPCRDRLCEFEDAVNQLEAEVRAFREDRHGHVAVGMRLWKRGALQRAFGRERRLLFEDDPQRAVQRATDQGRDLLIWAGKEPAGLAAPVTLRRVEDGFLRSRGLGAALVPALSLVTDDLGIYYDPNRPSRLERLLSSAPPPGASARAMALVERIVATGLSKYNLSGAALPPLPQGHRILVPGQVEDDASIRLGAGAVRTNLALLAQTRAENPGAVILFKPHPDVEAGLRPGALRPNDVARHADLLVTNADPIALIAEVQEVWTMTSLLGFEALLRGKRVTCLGAPFYAGWGLTRDLGPVPARRQARPDLATLAHAALIAYPRYFDPVSGLPCPPEVIAERLAAGTPHSPGLGLRLLAKAQGALASHAGWWR